MYYYGSQNANSSNQFISFCHDVQAGRKQGENINWYLD